MLIEILTVVAPLFICAGIGFFWNRLGIPFDSRMLAGLALTVGMPCLVFSSLTRLGVSIASFGKMAGIFALAFFCFAVIGAMILKTLRLDLSTYLPNLTANNTGNVGLPLCLFAFGDAGLALALPAFVIGTILNFTVGWTIFSGKLTLEIFYNNPIIYAAAAALGFVILGIEPPVWLANTTHIVGGLVIPMMILSLGAALSSLKVRSAGRSLVLAILKLAVGFGTGLALTGVFGLTGIERGILIIQCSLPTAVLNYAIAMRFDRRPDETAGIIVLTTIVFLIGLPALLLVVL